MASLRNWDERLGWRLVQGSAISLTFELKFEEPLVKRIPFEWKFAMSSIRSKQVYVTWTKYLTSSTRRKVSSRSNTDTILSTVKDIQEHNESVNSQIQQIEKNIYNLGKDDYNLFVKLEELEQHARRDRLEVTGIPIVPNDNPALLLQEASKISKQATYGSLIAWVKDRIIVKFTRREKRDEMYSKRKNLKSKRIKDLPSVACETESMSMRVSRHTEDGYKFIWTTNGKLLLKKSETSTTIQYKFLYNPRGIRWIPWWPVELAVIA